MTGKPADPVPDEPAPAPIEERPTKRSISLEDALQQAIDHNPSLAARGREVEAARARRDSKAAERLPQLRARAAYDHNLHPARLVPFRRAGEPGTFSRDLLSSGVIASVPLFTGKRIEREVDAARLLAEASAQRLARSSEELVYEVSSAFYGILAQRKVLESLDFSRKALQEHSERVRDLISVRKAARVDQLRTDVRVADLEQRLLREQNRLDLQEKALTILLGLDPTRDVIDPEGTLTRAVGPVPLLETALKQARSRRPDLKEARAQLESRARKLDVARVGRLPSLFLAASYGRRKAYDVINLVPATRRNEDVGTVGVALDFPIFEGGRIAARIREERALLKASQERLRALDLKVRVDVEAAVLNLRYADRRISTTQKAIGQAEESLRIEREKYDLGKGAIVDVLDAQTALLESQTNYYRALADHSVARAELDLAIGKEIGKERAS